MASQGLESLSQADSVDFFKGVENLAKFDERNRGRDWEGRGGLYQQYRYFEAAEQVIAGLSERQKAQALNELIEARVTAEKTDLAYPKEDVERVIALLEGQTREQAGSVLQS
ncbi:hypothetical protein A2335_03600 [Candidatus Peregrinibacteria bacterium RIFOXYB2_FULL_32_7]|nr:MAG: hypothetical protein A2335_03600 [Candidatus Peregrinibacteria bacterium RIFOXYB2_FULL_32_7]